MKLLFAPSGKRVIPYPPVGVAILAAELRAHGVTADVCDLEIELAARRTNGEEALVHRRSLHPLEAVTGDLNPELREYADHLWAVAGSSGRAPVGISVMGFDQVASALLLARTALEQGRPVIFGGQFWTERSASEAIHLLSPYGPVSVTVGDGWEAIAAFAAGRDAECLPNTTTGGPDARVVSGPRVQTKSLPPQPVYDWVHWESYEAFGSATYRNSRTVRRAHLYVWDKQCNFRCAFCRVATGSRAVLTPPVTVADSFDRLLGLGVEQLNFMTNELNPSRTYLLRLLNTLQKRGADASSWFTYIRADRLERADFGAIRSLGGRLARYGVESGSQRLLDLMRKDYDVTTMSRTLAHAAAEDMWNHINLLVGFPGEQDSDIDETRRFLEQNANVIHSVRINPFYLPPETPIARTPAQFGIELTEFASGWWKYRHRDGSEPDEEAVVERVERLSQTCVELGIGFAGTDPFFLVDVISRHDRVDQSTDYLKREYPIFWVPAPTDAYKAAIGGYRTSADWRKTALKRQRNYSLSICTD
ncbi:radical SAM protein [Streptomyces sp. MB09-01]|uniref:B12-binding domain-containing radical SAM protein n=1 Tax=Streptomyces sp. MB09-01 TaxID=3028666 RepID=UPI0029B8704D|nr:radical SAM protein [Streptomyces sp. MB09-01]MDX3537877.1 radical SAM protein [Streptomyces sp. MB09-01]